MRTTIVFCLFSLLAAPVASADILPPGSKGVTHRIIVVGLDRHPELTFVAYPTSFSDSVVVVEQATPFSFYKLSAPFLYAIPSDTRGEIAKDHLAGDGVARSSIGFELTSSVSESDPTDRIHTTYRVTGIEDGVIQLELAGTIYFDEHGNEIGGAAKRGSRTLVAIALAAMGLIVVLVAFRRRQALAAA